MHSRSIAAVWLAALVLGGPALAQAPSGKASDISAEATALQDDLIAMFDASAEAIQKALQRDQATFAALQADLEAAGKISDPAARRKALDSVKAKYGDYHAKALKSAGFNINTILAKAKTKHPKFSFRAIDHASLSATWTAVAGSEVSLVKPSVVERIPLSEFKYSDSKNCSIGGEVSTERKTSTATEVEMDVNVISGGECNASTSLSGEATVAPNEVGNIAVSYRSEKNLELRTALYPMTGVSGTELVVRGRNSTGQEVSFEQRKEIVGAASVLWWFDEEQDENVSFNTDLFSGPVQMAFNNYMGGRVTAGTGISGKSRTESASVEITRAPR